MPEFTMVYADEPVGSREHTTATMPGLQAWAKAPDIVRTNNKAPQHATLEDDYWVLGEDFRFFPSDPSKASWGLFSAAMSGPDGSFQEPLVLTLTLTGGLYSAIGLTLQFDPYGPTWCSDLQVQWYRQGQLIQTRDYQPDKWQYTCLGEAKNFDKIVVTFRAMSAPYRYLKMQAMTYGITRVFDSTELFGVDLCQSTDLLSDTVAVGTMDFTLRNKTDVGFMFQRKQQLRCTFGSELIGTYYITGHEKTGKNQYDIHTVDLVGLLEKAGEFAGNLYNGVRADVVAGEIFGSAIPWRMDEALKSQLIYGYLPAANRRDCLQQLAFRLSAMVVTAGREWVEITRLPQTVTSHIDALRGYESDAIETDALVTAVSVTAYSYTRASELTVLYESPLNGEERVKFSSPATGLQISGGTLATSAATYAVIRGTGGTVTLKGYTYTESKRIHTRENPLKGANDAEHPVDYTGMTLVSPKDVAGVLDACYNLALRSDVIKTRLLADGEKPGDRVEVTTDHDGVRSGHILQLDYIVSGKLAADAVILVEGSGS